MELYSRYTDSKNTLFVIVRRKIDVDFPGKNKRDIVITSSTIDLLNVHAEKVATITEESFKNHLANGTLVKLK